MYKKYFKRPLDIIFSILALIILSPILLIIAILVRFKLGSPVIFKQKRPGLKEKIFTIYKFRSMTDEKDENGELLPDNIRLTKFGKFLRSTSLDELPQFFNILKGEMSLIGPRPLSILYLPFYYDTEVMRFSVNPGITGLAQINGRNFLNWDEKLKLDVEYVNKMSFVLDFEILILTIKKVIFKPEVGVRGVDFLDESLDEIRPINKNYKEKGSF